MTILFAAIWAENKFTRLPKRPHCVANKIMLLSIELIGAALMARLRHATTRYYEGILQSTSSRIRTIECMFYASDHFAKNLTEDLVINTYSTFKIFKISFFFFLILRSSLANDCTSTMCGRHNESSYFKKQRFQYKQSDKRRLNSIFTGYKRLSEHNLYICIPRSRCFMCYGTIKTRDFLIAFFAFFFLCIRPTSPEPARRFSY